MTMLMHDRRGLRLLGDTKFPSIMVVSVTRCVRRRLLWRHPALADDLLSSRAAVRVPRPVTAARGTPG
jgi:hypothetical protein